MSSTPAEATSERPGSSDERRGAAARARAGRPRRARRGSGDAAGRRSRRRARRRGRSSRRAKPFVEQPPAEGGEGPRRRRERLEVGDLRADVALQPDDLDPGELAAPGAGSRARARCRRRTCSRAGRSRCRGASAASMSGFTRRETRAVRPRAAAAAPMPPISSSLSALHSPIPCSRPSAISASLLPTPAKTIRSGGKPARSAASSSPPETMSAPAPSAGEQAQDGAVAVGLHRVADPVRHRREGPLVGRKAASICRAAVDVERRPELARPPPRAARRPPRAHRGACSNPLTARPPGPASRARLVLAQESPRPRRRARATPTRFGKICRPFIRSPQAQTSVDLARRAEAR